MRRTGTVVCAAALLGLVPAAAAQAPRPTLRFDRSCYGEQEEMTFSGEQYTPGGEVNVIFANDGHFGALPVNARPDGTIGETVAPPDPDMLLAADELRAAVAVTANDRTRQEDGTLERDPRATVGNTTIRLTRSVASLSPRAPRPGKRFRVTVRGLADSAGMPLYLHYYRGSRPLGVRRLGRLQGACGDLDARVSKAFGGRVKPGRYQLFISTERGDPTGGSYFKIPVRVRKGAASSAAGPRMAPVHRPDAPAARLRRVAA